MANQIEGKIINVTGLVNGSAAVHIDHHPNGEIVVFVEAHEMHKEELAEFLHHMAPGVEFEIRERLGTITAVSTSVSFAW